MAFVSTKKKVYQANNHSEAIEEIALDLQCREELVESLMNHLFIKVLPHFITRKKNISIIYLGQLKPKKKQSKISFKYSKDKPKKVIKEL